MYKVLIVDDDSIVRRGLIQNIPWEENGYKIVGTAANGIKGFEMIENLYPDIVICDIKMPIMDGMEMTCKVKEKYPEIKIILLSGYGEFEYAKEALKMKVSEYLLKPIDNEPLLDAVKRVSREIENEKKLQDQIRQSVPLLRQVFLTRLVGGKFKNKDNIRYEMNFLDISLDSNSFIVVVVSADDFQSAEYCSEVMEQELLKFGISNMAQEILQGSCRGTVFDPGGDEIVLIICGDGTDHKELLEKVYAVSEDIRLNVEKYLRTTVTIGIGMAHDSFNGIAKSYNEALSAIEHRHILGKNKVLCIQDTGLPSGEIYIDIYEQQKELLSMVKLGLTGEALQIVDDVRKAVMMRNFIPLWSIRLIGMEIAILLSKEVENWFKEEKHQSYHKQFYNLCNSIKDLQTVDEIFDKIKLLINEITFCINSERTSQQREIVEKAIEYINKNYTNEQLCLQEVAREVHVSPTYLSIIFKKEKDINFLDYILNIKMNKAMELLRGGNLKTYEVAEKVGYSNPQYFSVCFKKYTGMSPLQFKQKDS